MTATRILFVVSECAPFAKVGGLADVAGALPKALRRLGYDARIVLPLYAGVNRARHGIVFERPFTVQMGPRDYPAAVWSGRMADVPVRFIECGRFFDRPGIYGDTSGDYPDNAARFAFFCRAALETCRSGPFIPDIVHCHDWHTALLPFFLKTAEYSETRPARAASVLTIHNIGYQGLFPAGALSDLGIGPPDSIPGQLEYFGRINFLKAGIKCADYLATVSPTHARELLDFSSGGGLTAELLERKRDFKGILNGVDYAEWDPARDPLLPAHYTAAEPGGKAVCKAALQRTFGLDERPDLPVFGIVARLARQKGLGLLAEIMPRVLDNMAIQFVALGTGDRFFESFLLNLARRHPRRAAARIEFSDKLSHLIEAGGDFFLMPSLYEPCGLTQMYAMLYGTLPIVRAVGGLADTVENYDEASGRGTGFKFQDAAPRALYNTIGWAVSTWFDRPRHIALLRRQAMRRDFSWDKAAREYSEVYAALKPGPAANSFSTSARKACGEETR
ncbi:MAG: glycogen synthase GlgA [Kiritimatiellia bacterium]|jgi:starch synthase